MLLACSEDVEHTHDKLPCREGPPRYRGSTSQSLREIRHLAALLPTGLEFCLPGPTRQYRYRSLLGCEPCSCTSSNSSAENGPLSQADPFQVAVVLWSRCALAPLALLRQPHRNAPRHYLCRR